MKIDTHVGDYVTYNYGFPRERVVPRLTTDAPGFLSTNVVIAGSVPY